MGTTGPVGRIVLFSEYGICDGLDKGHDTQDQDHGSLLLTVMVWWGNGIDHAPQAWDHGCLLTCFLFEMGLAMAMTPRIGDHGSLLLSAMVWGGQWY